MCNQNYFFQATDKDLEKRFRPFGTIEKISIHKHKYHFKNREHGDRYAFVTFAESKSAYNAMETSNRLLQKKSEKKIIPADTWKQPKMPDNQMDYDCFEQLNDDCLLHILDYLDFDTLLDLTEVSNRLKTLITGIYCPKKKHLEFSFDRSEMRSSAPTTLARMRKTLLAVGQFLVSVKITINFDFEPPNCNRIIEKFVQYLGTNLKTLNINGFLLTNENISKFVPILQQIETLHLCAWNEDIHYDVDLSQICINLKKLRISQDTKFWSNSRPWKKLENLSLGYNESITVDTLNTFFQNNPQLKRLNFSAYDTDDAFWGISNYLKNLEKLTVYNGYPNIDSNHILKLEKLEKLRILKLKYIETPYMNAILSTLATKLTQLTYLKILVYVTMESFKPDPSLILLIAENMKNLKHFHLEHCAVEDNFIFDFIKIGKQLKTFAYMNDNFEPNIKFFSKILKICQEDEREGQLELVFNSCSNKNDLIDLVSLTKRNLNNSINLFY